MATSYRFPTVALGVLANFLIGTICLAADVLTFDASARPPAASAAGFHLGTATAPGHTLTVDSRSLVRDGKPWVAISGEFHFSRCPEAEWRDELLKIKAGGISTREYLGDKLLNDDFYNGRPFEIGLRRYGPAAFQEGLVLKILPLRQTRLFTLPIPRSSNTATTTPP